MQDLNVTDTTPTAPEAETADRQPVSRAGGLYPWPMQPGNFVVVPKDQGKSAVAAACHHAKRYGTGARYQLRSTDDGRACIRRVDGLENEP